MKFWFLKLKLMGCKERAQTTKLVSDVCLGHGSFSKPLLSPWLAPVFAPCHAELPTVPHSLHVHKKKPFYSLPEQEIKT